MSFETAFAQLMGGLTVGMVFFLIAVGLSIIFGTLKVLNLAHGGLFMIGAYLCFWMTSKISGALSGFWWSLLLAPIGVALFGGMVEVLLLRRLYGREFLDQFLLTFALILIIEDLCKLVWGPGFFMVATPGILKGKVDLWGVIIPNYNIFIILCGPAIFFGLGLLFDIPRLE
jgi:branched-chain amino acid transport system permease protein